MKIAFVCNEYPLHAPSGGIGTFTHTIARALAARGHEITVVGHGKQSGEWHDQAVRVVILPESNIRGAAWFVNRRRLRRWLASQWRARAIDIVEIPESHGLLPFDLGSCPTVLRLHLNLTTRRRHAGQRPRWLIWCLERTTLSRHRHWIAVSKYILETTVAEYTVRPSRSAVVYNPVSSNGPSASLPSGFPDRYVLYAGTVSDRKGAYVLAEAARTFLTEYPDLHLTYVGGLTVEHGQRADKTIRDILGEEFVRRLHFTGPVGHDEVLAYMKRATVFAFPSKLESFGLVPVEAMSCGVPVVYSTLHAGPEIIDDGVTGLLADPHSPSDVAEKVLRVLRNPAYAFQLAVCGKRSVEERFSLQRCIDRTLAFYDSARSRSMEDAA